ncbi:MAG: hypothetical protein PHS31_02950 [Victivallaceae bacterium]|nr:hypothetical protein [Victivallaceae bacterium]MDD4180480.1 hypothetical protein [Victivallaceae bacterium]
MKKMLTGIMLVAGLLCGLVFSASANADQIINWMKGPRKDIKTIIIVSNYKKSRLMADLIQNESRQPYLLLPAKGQKNIYFCPVNSKRPALQISNDKVGRFISFANPNKVIVIGDEAYVPRKYLAQIDKKIPIIIIPVTDWSKAAVAIGELMNLPNLASDYSRLKEKMDQGFYRPSDQAPSSYPVETITSEDIVLPAGVSDMAEQPAQTVATDSENDNEGSEVPADKDTLRKEVSVQEANDVATVSKDDKTVKEPVVIPSEPVAEPEAVEEK